MPFEKWKNRGKIDTKSRFRKVSENNAKILEKGPKIDPKGLPKVDKIEVKIEAWKNSKFSEKTGAPGSDFETY